MESQKEKVDSLSKIWPFLVSMLAWMFDQKNKILENKRLGTWKYPGKEKEHYRHKPPILGVSQC